MLGLTVCGSHGGRAPHVKAAGLARVATAKAQRLVDLLDVGPCEDPVSALLDLAGDAVALKDVLRRVVSELQEISYRGGIGQGMEEIRGELTAYMQAMQRCESILGRILSLNLESRRLAISERDGRVLLQAIEATLASLKLDPVTLTKARERLAQELAARNG